MTLTITEMNQLADDDFERLVKTLLLVIIGPGVTPFTKGKDGAREAIYSGKANYPSVVEQWDGNWIFQVKYSDISAGLDKARNQVKYSIDTELSKLEDYGYLKRNKCDNYIFITNVPFSGESKKGLHDYVENKKLNYRVKNFGYWDGEKILGFANSNPKVRETFFPVPGIEEVPDEEKQRIQAIYVKPSQYDDLKRHFLRDRIVSVVGQPHVGKTATAIYLSCEVATKLNLSKVYQIPIIDNITKIPKLLNCVIIFDDLYGDLTFEEIGKRSKILNTLLKDNYIIVTSRDYIFKEAIEKHEVTEALDTDLPTIIQEGSYTSKDLETILMNHLSLKLKLSSIKQNTIDLVTNNKSLVINQLRFPHNIQLFVDSLDSSVSSKFVLKKNIEHARQIENIILSWVSHQPDENINILLAASLGRIVALDDLKHICDLLWNYTLDQIMGVLKYNFRLIDFEQGRFKFVHPSFRLAIFNSVRKEKLDTIVQLMARIFSEDTFTTSLKKPYKVILQEIVQELNHNDLNAILNSKNIDKETLSIIWPSLLKRDYETSINILRDLLKRKRTQWNYIFYSFVNAKDFMKKREVTKFITYLYSKRTHKDRLIDELIFFFSFAVREEVVSFINLLDGEQSADLKLKIRLLGALCSKYRALAVPELLKISKSSSAAIRKQVYSALNMSSVEYRQELRGIFVDLAKAESDEENRAKILKSVSRIATRSGRNVKYLGPKI